MWLARSCVDVEMFVDFVDFSSVETLVRASDVLCAGTILQRADTTAYH